MEIIRNATNTATFKITDAPVMTLSAEDNAKLSKLLGEGFKRPVIGINIR